MYTNKQMWSVSYPILLSLLAQNVINVTDTAFFGHVSEVALGASAMGGLFYICVFTIAFGFSTGSQIVIARRNGEGRYSDVGPVMIQGVMFLFVMALLLFGFTKAFGGNRANEDGNLQRFEFIGLSCNSWGIKFSQFPSCIYLC